MPGGGHFAPTEEPELLAGDIAAFFATVDRYWSVARASWWP